MKRGHGDGGPVRGRKGLDRVVFRHAQKLGLGEILVEDEISFEGTDEKDIVAGRTFAAAAEEHLGIVDGGDLAMDVADPSPDGGVAVRVHVLVRIWG